MIRSLLLISLLIPLPHAEASRHSRSRHPSRRPSAISESSLQGRLLTIEDQRVSRDPTLERALRSLKRRIVKTAILAAGRIGDISQLEPLSRFLDRKDKSLKKAAIFSLSLMDNEIARKILRQNIPMQTDPEILADLLVAVARGGDEKTVPLLASYLKDGTAPVVMNGACHGLCLLWSRLSTETPARAPASISASIPKSLPLPPDLLPKLARLAQGADPLATSAAAAIAHYRGDPSLLPVTNLLDTLTKTASPTAKSFTCRALGRIRSPQVSQLLPLLLLPSEPLPVRIEMVRALGNQLPTQAVLDALKRSLSDPSDAVIVSALESVSQIGGATAPISVAVDGLLDRSTSIWVRGAALKTLAKIQPVLARPKVTVLLEQPSSPLFPATVAALANLGSQEDLNRLAVLANHANLIAAEEAVLALGSFPEGRITPPMKAELRRALERGDTALTALIAAMVEKLKWREFAPSLAAICPLLHSPDQIEAKVAVLNALAAVGDHSHVPLLERAMNDPEKLVVVAAAAALKAITGKDESGRIPLNSKVDAPPVDMKAVGAAVHARVVLRTSRGEIELAMVEEAPLTALSFIRLVESGFYNGKIFHRVVPNFVVQGGDPRGDGFGGPGRYVRDELSALIHDRGTVGMAASGKDLGGSQFFFNLAPNLHLDGHYTLFARVTRGMDVVDRLEVGDPILSASVKR